MNVLFFKMYWKPRPVFIGVFYAGVIGLLVWVLAAPSAGVTKITADFSHLRCI